MLSLRDKYSQLRTKLYDKRNDFNFPIVNFPFMCSNISVAPAYKVYISQSQIISNTFIIDLKLQDKYNTCALSKHIGKYVYSARNAGKGSAKRLFEG
jgi:hypothetical protein